MKPAAKKRLLQELGWIASMGALLTLLLGVAVVKLDSSKARTRALHEGNKSKLELLRGRELSMQEQESLRSTEAILEEWVEAAASQSDRITAISAAAAVAGVTLMSLRDLDTQTSEDGWVVTYSHSVSGLGDYQQIATFLDELYDDPGMVTVQGLEIEHGEEAGVGQVLASMRVNWVAPSDPIAPREEVKR